MTYQDNGCNRQRRLRGGYCSSVICFLALLFVLALGLILGAVFFETILPVLASVIAFAAAVLAVIIALLIYYFWCGRNG